MQELMFVIAELMPMEEVLDKLQKAIQSYQLTKSEDSLSDLRMYSIMFLTKSKMQSDGKDCIESIKEFELAKKGMNLLKTKSE